MFPFPSAVIDPTRIKNPAASSGVFFKVAGAGSAPDRRGARDGYHCRPRSYERGYGGKSTADRRSDGYQLHAASGGEFTLRD